MTARKSSPDPAPQLTDEQQLAEDPNTDAELAEEAGEPMVRYAGEFTFREITADEWSKAGVADMPTVRWKRGESLPQSAFTEQALLVLRQDGSFEVP